MSDVEASAAQDIFRSDVENRLSRFSWWKGALNRQSANAILESQNVGSYLMRYSSAACRLALSIRLQDRVANYAVLWRVSDGFFALEEMCDTWKRSVPDLLHAVDSSDRIPGGVRLVSLPKKNAAIDNIYAPGPSPPVSSSSPSLGSKGGVAAPPPKPSAAGKKSPASVLAKQARLSAQLSASPISDETSSVTSGTSHLSLDNPRLSMDSNGIAVGLHALVASEERKHSPLGSVGTRQGLCGNVACNATLTYTPSKEPSLVTCPGCNQTSRFPALSSAEQGGYMKPPPPSSSSPSAAASRSSATRALPVSNDPPPFGAPLRPPAAVSSVSVVVGTSDGQEKVKRTYQAAPSAPSASGAMNLPCSGSPSLSKKPVPRTYGSTKVLHTYSQVPDK